MATQVSMPADSREWVAYARFSTEYQHSIADQIYACREFAKENGAVIPDRNIFTDAAVSGKTSRRPGLTALREKLASGSVGVLVTLTSSRLHRNAYKARQFIEEDVIEHDARCVCIRSGVDTAAPEWRLIHGAHAMADEVLLQATAKHVQEAHRGLLRAGRVCGTITFGYRATPIGTEKTRRGKLASRYAVDPDVSQWVVRIFNWFVLDRLSLAEIARQLVAQRAPTPPKSGIGWTFRTVRWVLTNRRYTGVWSYGTRETTWKSRADYARQKLRDKPLETIRSDDLRIISDDMFEAAQRELVTRDRCGGRRPKNRKPRARILNGLLICAKHDRPLIVGNSFYCPECRRTDDADRLVSCVTPELAVERISDSLAMAIGADTPLVASLPLEMAKVIEQLRRPDPQQLRETEARKRKLDGQINFLLDNIGERPEDQAEAHQHLRELRGQRAAVDCELVQLREAMAKAAQVPDVAELTRTVAEMHHVLVSAANGDQREQQALRNVIFQLTGGRVLCSQCTAGPSGKPCLNASFSVNLLAAAARLPSSIDDASKTICVSLREPTWAEVNGEKIKCLVDGGKLQRDVAKQMGACRRRMGPSAPISKKSGSLLRRSGRKATPPM